MHPFKKMIFQIMNTTIVGCFPVYFFDYKTAGTTTVTFEYLLCGSSTPSSVTYTLYNTNGVFATYEIFTPLCVEYGSFNRVSGLVNINNIVYGSNSCTV